MTQNTQAGPPPAGANVADLVERLRNFDGPPELFVLNLLAVQCHLAGAEQGALLRRGDDGRPEVAALFPQQPGTVAAPAWLSPALEQMPAVLAANATAIHPLHAADALYGQPAKRLLVLLPVRDEAGNARGIEAFPVEPRGEAHLEQIRERLELTVGLLSTFEMRLTAQKRQADMERLRRAMETLSALNEHDRFAAAAMAFCNDLADRWTCLRTSLAILKGRYLPVQAISHTEKFNRKMKLVQDLEAAMEECLDQDVEIVYPPPAEPTYIGRAAEEFSRCNGPVALLALPLRHAGEVAAVVLLERDPARPFAADEIEALRLTADLCAARLVNLHAHDLWLGARLAKQARQLLAFAVGAKHTWAKVLAIALAATLAFLVFAKGDYQTESPFALDAVQRQVVPAPFDGYIATVLVEPGATVEGGKTLLATLDTAELRLKLASAQAERMGYRKQAAAAERDNKLAEKQIALAQADRAEADIRLAEYRLRQAQLVSPRDGVIIVGDLKRQLGAPVKTGDVLFEVAPLSALRAELAVGEDEIAEVRLGQRGEIATASYPDRKIGFTVERINPLAEVVNQRNVFKVRVLLDRVEPWMRPGMEGVAKVTVGRRAYGWIWTHRLVNWVRMKLWI